MTVILCGKIANLHISEVGIREYLGFFGTKSFLKVGVKVFMLQVSHVCRVFVEFISSVSSLYFIVFSVLFHISVMFIHRPVNTSPSLTLQHKPAYKLSSGRTRFMILSRITQREKITRNDEADGKYLSRNC